MDLVGQRIILQNEELKNGVPASEGTMQRMGKQGNFLIEKVWSSITFNMNGHVGSYGNIQNNVDQIRHIPWDCSIISVCASAYNAGTDGSTIFELVRRPVGGGPIQSIFSTQPNIPYSAGNYARTIKRFADNTLLYNSAGASNPVLAIINLDAGDVLELNLIGVQSNSLNASLEIALRIR